MGSGADRDTKATCSCKVGTLVETVDLEELDEKLERLWQEEGVSVRRLARYVGERVLEQTLEDAGAEFTVAELDTIYDLVRGIDVSDAASIEKRRQLEREGVDVDALDDRFVSHQTVYRHLTGCLGIEYERDPVDAASTLEQIRAVQHRTATVAADRVERLAANAVLDHADYQVIVDVSATCEHCGSYYELGELVSGGGCGCNLS